MESIVLKRFDNYFSAYILQTKLTEFGVQSYVHDENTVTITPFFSNAIGNIKVIVSEKDFTEASRLLKIFEEEENKLSACPNCNEGKMILHSVDENANNGSVNVAVFKCDTCGFEMNDAEANNHE